jgi:histidinol-phosphate aminotransferase
LNLNHYVSSPYIFYPNENNPLLFNSFLEFLNLEKQAKAPGSQPITLNADQALFLSSSEAIDLLIRTFCEPKQDSICIMNPAFPYYAFAAINNNVDVLDIPLTGSYYEEMQLDVVLARQPKIIFIPFPNNPVGSVVQRDQVMSLLQQAQGIVVIDEAYIEFADELSLIDAIQDHPNLVILRSFSKVWGMAGIRCGAAIAQPHLINTLKKVRPPCSFPTHTQHMILQMLQKPEVILEVKRQAKEERLYLIQQLQQIKGVKKIYPSQTNFILAEFDEHQLIFEELKHRGILIRRIDHLVPQALRISLGTRADHDCLIQAICDAYKTVHLINN